MNILGIETSCDETSAAVVQDGKKLLSHVVSSSADMHIKYGGIVPEVAARKQVEAMIPVLTEAMRGLTATHIDALAVTVGPGLIGSLLVGVETAKTLTSIWHKPIIPVNHVLAHPYAAFLEHNISLPAIALVVSGGHTELYFIDKEHHLKWLGGSTDDAAGECFDKCARLLGFPYPGGPAIAKAAMRFEKNQTAYALKLPRPLLHDGSSNFSFSGLKTAALREWQKLNHPSAAQIQVLAYEIQEAITDVLVAKTLASLAKFNVGTLILSGGVAANQRLKEKFAQKTQDKHLEINLITPSPKYCVDSASFIAAYAYYHQQPVPWQKVQANPQLAVDNTSSL